MAKDPAFLFYPGDWLGGTMGLTLEQKGAYLELLILQFNNGKFTEAQAKQVLSICFSVAWPMLQLKFSTDGTFYWNDRLKTEIEKRKNFANSRRINALHPKNKKAYAKHMENENENTNETINTTGNENFLVPMLFEKFKFHLPKYPGSQQKDFKPLFSIANFLAEQGKLKNATDNPGQIIEAWDVICQVIKADKFYSQKSLSTIANHIQEILQISLNGKSNGKPDYGSKERAKEYDRLFAERYPERGSATG